MKRQLAVTFGLFFLLTTPSQGLAQQDHSTQPYFDARQQQMEYVGPGREEPEPANLREVSIGYFGPSDPATDSPLAFASTSLPFFLIT